MPGSTLSVPVSTNKPSSAFVWKYGNVQFGGTNPDDDINEVDFEIRRRVQVQYRIRTIADVDFTTFPNGINDPVVLAQGTNASSTALPFAVAAEDAGLFVAGNGSAAHQTTLGTLDGRVLGIPIAKVARTAGVTEIIAGHVTDLRIGYGVNNFVQRVNDIIQGNLTISHTATREFIVEATNNNTRATIATKGKTSGGTLVHGGFESLAAGELAIKAVSAHPINFYTSNVCA